jgi:hypothetical protein
VYPGYQLPDRGQVVSRWLNMMKLTADLHPSSL